MRLALVVLLLCALLVSSCSGSHGTGEPPDGAPADAMLTGDAYRRGSLGISQTIAAGMPIEVALASASFIDAPASAGLHLTERDEGPCHIAILTGPAEVLSGARNFNASAGVLTIAGGSDAPVTLGPDGAGRYAGSQLTANRWHAGDAVSIHAAGAVVPSFDASGTFPARPMMTSPAMPSDTTPVPIDRSGFHATWTPLGGSDMVAVSVSQSTSTKIMAIDCIVAGTSGTATIAASALTDLVPGAAGINIKGIVTQHVTAGSLDVQIDLQNIGLQSDATVR